MSRTFGIELEVHLPRNGSIPELATRLDALEGVSCAGGRSYRAGTSEAWKIVHDGSLRGRFGSAEVVSPVLSGANGLEQARKVAAELTAYGCTVGTDCGYHCHVFAGDFTPEQLKKLCLNYIWFEDFFDHIMPPSRRGSLATYCQSNRARHTRTYGTEALNAWFPRLAPLTTKSEIIESVCGDSRYWKLNLHSLNVRPTVEFRQHSGTTDPDKVVQWARLMLAFVDKSICSKPRPRTVTRDLTPVEEMNRFFAYIPVEPETKAFYMARRKALHRDETSSAREQVALIANGETIARQMIETMNARRARVMNFARPQIRTGHRLANEIQSLNAGLSGVLPYGTTNRGEYLARRIQNARAMFPALFRAAAPLANAA